MSASYQLSLQDYIEAQQLSMKKSKGFVFYVVAALIYFALILFCIYRFKNRDFLVMERYRDYYNSNLANEDRYLMLYVYSFGFILFIGKIFPKFNPLAYWNTKKDLKKNFVKQESKQISITEEGIAIASQNYRKYYQWQGITKATENKKIFLLYHSRNKEYTIVPKRIFETEAELTNFQQLLNSRETQIVAETESI